MDFVEGNGSDLLTLRHSAAHVLAQAVTELYPEVKLGIGPAIEDGYYYDFDRREGFTPDDLEKIEERMKKIITANLPIVRREVTRDEAEKLFADEPYKLELIAEIEDPVLTVYEQDGFADLCRGPHLASTGQVKAFKLLSVAGAYWRGSEKNPMLQRIYGTAFPTRQALDEYIVRLEEARKRDHRKLGKELDLFSFHEEGPGFPFWHPKGTIILNEIIEHWRRMHRERGYQEVKTPMILNEALWHRSGHWDTYRENMYFVDIDEHTYAVKPMNCPGVMLIYREALRSYRDLPLKYAELGHVHRHEKSGVLTGLFHVRAFTQDDAHVFCTPDQIQEEIIKVIDLVIAIYEKYGFKDYRIELSTKPEKRIGSDEVWETAESALHAALKAKGIEYAVNPGEGAFYGPKIDFHVHDTMRRSWQLGTIQLDFAMPERFDLEYIGDDGKGHRPVMIHRAILGSLERFVGILVEEYAGAFPLWLAPVQIIMLPIADRHVKYAEEVAGRLRAKGLRVDVDARNEKTGFKIREAQMLKIPYMLIVGDREEEAGKVAVRKREEGDLGAVPVDDFIAGVENELTD
ncbi:MAG: threonine--tRNA ligase [Armatimonadetes bacterium]|nr:threonine--tRNA ligase [Armatimonadota bacterium]